MAKKRGKKKRTRKKGIPGTGVRVKGHTRSPRGKNKGKRAVYVGGYRRRLPRRK
jgi:hypothetical protein